MSTSTTPISAPVTRLYGNGWRAWRSSSFSLKRTLPAPVGPGHSHSMVPGGFDVTSSTTRLTSRTSLVIRVEMRASTS